MSRCYLCKNEITDENVSIEHILPNAIGGRLKSSSLICKECNSKFGDTSDACLAKQLEFFANQLNIKRERGSVQNVEMTRESTGETYLVSPEGDLVPRKPLIKERESNGNLEIYVKANDEKTIESILIGLKRKYPKLDITKFKDALKHEVEYIDEPLHGTISIDGKKIFPAILKIAVNYYIEKGGDIEFVDSAIEDLKNNQTHRVDLIIKEGLVVESNSEEVLHYIFINGCREKKKLYAIIELYSTVQFVVKLSDNYNGEDVQHLYLFDVLKKQEIQKEIGFVPDFDFIFNYDYSTVKLDYDVFRKRIERILKIGSQRRLDKSIHKITEQSFKKILGEPDGRPITHHDVCLLVDEIMKGLTPIIANSVMRDKRVR